MPQILIVTDSPDSAGEVVYRESVSAVHLASEHSGDQLVERLAWAIGDAALAERRARQEGQTTVSRLDGGPRRSLRPAASPPARTAAGSRARP